VWVGQGNLHGYFELTVASTIELQYWVTAGTATTGLGAPVNTGDVEVYASLLFHRHAEVGS